MPSCAFLWPFLHQIRSQVGHVAAGVVFVALAVGVGDGVRLGAVRVQAGAELAVVGDVADGVVAKLVRSAVVDVVREPMEIVVLSDVAGIVGGVGQVADDRVLEYGAEVAAAHDLDDVGRASVGVGGDDGPGVGAISAARKKILRHKPRFDRCPKMLLTEVCRMP